jgi:uncharacterized protein YndB with AHSA1/START domain
MNDMNETQIELVREINAPVEKVWGAWTNPEMIAQWWGPEGFSTRVEQIDLKPQGGWCFVMTDDETGDEYPANGIFTEIVEGKKIVTTDNFDDAAVAANPNLPVGIVLTVAFTPIATGTRVALTIDHPTAESKAKHEAMGVVGGWESSFNSLETFLARES